jgi:hypothetical protein
MVDRVEMNIYQRINAVMKEVTYVQKDTTVSTGNNRTYKAVTHDQVLSVLRAAMVSHGIVTVVCQSKGAMLQYRNLQADIDIKQNLYEGTYDVSFVNIVDPTQRVSVVIEAHASDTGDKAPSKCVTTAVKYAMLKTFGLETGDNDESRIQEQQDAKLIEHNAVVREWIPSILAIKQGIADSQISSAYEAWAEMPNDVKQTLWRATTKGGIWEPSERAIMKSNEWNDARKAWHGLFGIGEGE